MALVEWKRGQEGAEIHTQLMEEWIVKELEKSSKVAVPAVAVTVTSVCVSDLHLNLEYKIVNCIIL